MIELPDKKVKATSVSPKTLVLFSIYKTGKTTAFNLLSDSLIIDFEHGTDELDAMKVNIDNAQQLKELITALKDANKKLGKFKYRYGILDTVSALEDIAADVALSMYKATPIGKDTKITDIFALEYGGGYYWHRKAFKTIINDLSDCFERIILSGHLKD